VNQLLRDELAAIIQEECGKRPVELILSTGETLSQEAMNLARAYDVATAEQQQALDAVAALFRD